jgi:hypothetical protein
MALAETECEQSRLVFKRLCRFAPAELYYVVTWLFQARAHRFFIVSANVAGWWISCFSNQVPRRDNIVKSNAPKPKLLVAHFWKLN